jgi:hypothetical protein
VRVEVDDRADELVAHLATVGVTAKAATQTSVDVSVDDPATLDTVRDAVDDLGLALLALTGRRHSLDELFMEAHQ